MSIKLERTIWPVGHGAFYTEQFTDVINRVQFSVAYDCGGRNIGVINPHIQEVTRNHTQPIDLLFISHFHADHINGLPLLLDKKMVRRIMLPQLSQEVVLEAIVYNFIQASNGGNTLVDPNDNVINIQTQLINWVQEGAENITQIVGENENRESQVIYINEGREVDGIRNVPINLPPTIPSGSQIQINSNNPIWRYIPVCYIDSTNSAKLLADLKAKFPDIDNGDDTINWRNVVGILQEVLPKEERGKGKPKYKNIGEIKGIYENIFHVQKGEQPHNNYSMPVYSGPMVETSLRYARPCLWGNGGLMADDIDIFLRAEFNILAFHSAHCLYTGDFEANVPAKLIKLKSILQDLWAKVSLLQIPHHISDSNYNPDLYDHRMLCFGSVNDKGDESFTFDIWRKIIFVHHCPALVVTEVNNILYFEYFVQ